MGSEAQPDRLKRSSCYEELICSSCRNTKGHKGGRGATGEDAAFADEEELGKMALHSLG